MTSRMNQLDIDEIEALVNSYITGVHALSSLDLHDGDTLVLAQLGDRRFTQDEIKCLPDNLEIIDLDFSEFSDKEEIPTVLDLTLEHDDWPLSKISTLQSSRDVTRISFSDFIDHMEELIGSKSTGSVKCFFDLSEYRFRLIKGSIRSTKYWGYKQANIVAVTESGENKWETYTLDWDALDLVVASFLRENDPVMLSYTEKWDVFLHVLLATFICGNGTAATLVPEAYLSSRDYERARSAFLHQGLVQRVTFLSKSNANQFHPDLVVTSQIPTDGVDFVYDESINQEFGGAESPLNNSQPSNLGYRRVPVSKSTSLADASERFMSWYAFNGDNRALNRKILNNGARLSYESSRLYVLTESQGCKLGEIVSRISPVASYSADARISNQPDGFNRGDSCRSESEKNTDRSFLAVSTSSFDGIASLQDRGNYRKGENPNVSGTPLDHAPSAEYLLEPYDILISRINRVPTNRYRLSERLLAKPRVVIVPEVAATKNDLVCAASSLCLRSVIDDPVHSLALYYYFSKGAGNEILSALATQNSSLTWNQLKSLEVSPTLDPHSTEWQEYRKKFCEQAQRVIDLQRERDEMLERLDAAERAAIELASQL